MAPFGDKTASAGGGSGPVACDCTLQQAYTNGGAGTAGKITETATKGVFDLVIDPAADPIHGVGVIAEAPTGAAGPGITIPVSLEAISKGHTIAGEGGPVGIATAMHMLMQATASAGLASGITGWGSLLLEGQEVERWTYDCNDNETLGLCVPKIGGMLQVPARIKRDPGSGILYAGEKISSVIFAFDGVNYVFAGGDGNITCAAGGVGQVELTVPGFMGDGKDLFWFTVLQNSQPHGSPVLAFPGIGGGGGPACYFSLFTGWDPPNPSPVSAQAIDVGFGFFFARMQP